MTDYPRDTLVRVDLGGSSGVLLVYADPEDTDTPWMQVTGEAAGAWVAKEHVEDIRPLAVFAPDNLSEMEALAKALVEAMHAAGDKASAANGVHPATVAAALRAVSRRIPEPTRRFAVVTDVYGHDWTRRGPTQHSSFEWLNLETAVADDWVGIHGPTLVSAGIEEDR